MNVLAYYNVLDELLMGWLGLEIWWSISDTTGFNKRPILLTNKIPMLNEHWDVRYVKCYLRIVCLQILLKSRKQHWLLAMLDVSGPKTDQETIHNTLPRLN